MTRSPQTRRRGRPRQETDTDAAPVKALDRGIQVLRALSRDKSATLTSLALSVDLPPSSVHRILTTLERNDMVEFHDSDQEWSIGVDAFRIGSAFIRGDKIVEIGVEMLQRLVDQTGETSNLAVENKGEVVFVAQVETLNPVRALFSTGTRVHMHVSGIGKSLLAQKSRDAVQAIVEDKGLPEFTPNTITSLEALLADLEVTRQRGWALDDEEGFSGMRCIAAPIFNAHGRAAAGISTSGPTARMHDGILDEIGAKVRHAAEEVTRMTGGTAPTGDESRS